MREFVPFVPAPSLKNERYRMKRSILFLGAAGAMALLAGCSAPVALKPVGPNPGGFQTATVNGQLEVFSAESARMEGDNPIWRQHSDYYICNEQGKRLERVENALGYYARTPRLVTLPAGKYIVKARAKDALLAEVPVVIQPGEITKVHLDGQWQPVANRTQLVWAPSGYPVGWRVNAAK